MLGYRIISTILASSQKVSEFAENERISIESLIHTAVSRETHMPQKYICPSEKVKKLGKETDPNTSLLQNNLVRQQSYNRVIRLHLDHPRVW